MRRSIVKRRRIGTVDLDMNPWLAKSRGHGNTPRIEPGVYRDAVRNSPTAPTQFFPTHLHTASPPTVYIF